MKIKLAFLNGIYSGRYLFYLTSSYGGEVAVIADSIEFLPLAET